MRIVLAHVLAAAALVASAPPAVAGDPDTTAPPLPQGPPSTVPPAPAAHATDGPPGTTTPAPEPEVDPAYGERPDAHESAQRMGPNEVIGMRQGRDIVVHYHPDRSRQNITTLALLGAAGLAFGGVGLYYHLDSRSATDEVKAHRYTGETWTTDRQDTYDRAHNSAAIAGISYGIGGAFVIATAIVYMVTEPGMETLVIHPHTNPPVKPLTLVSPLPGGAFVSRGWEF